MAIKCMAATGSALTLSLGGFVIMTHRLVHGATRQSAGTAISVSIWTLPHVILIILAKLTLEVTTGLVVAQKTPIIS